MNISPRRVQQLHAEGLPREGRGRYNIGECMAWFIRYLQRKLEEKAVPNEDGEYIGVTRERARLLSAEAALKEIELARERGQLVAIRDVEHEFIELVQTTKARIMAVGPRLAAEITGNDTRDEVQRKIEASLREALIALAKGRKNGDTAGHTTEPADASTRT